MSTHVNNKGYVICQFTIDGKRVIRLVHRLVASAFIGDTDGLEINHKDFNKQNNFVENLEIVTRAENAAHYKGSDIANAAGRKISKIKTKPKIPKIVKPIDGNRKRKYLVYITIDNYNYLKQRRDDRDEFLNQMLESIRNGE